MLRLGNTITHKCPVTYTRNMKKFEGQSVIIVELLTATGVSIMGNSSKYQRQISADTDH